MKIYIVLFKNNASVTLRSGINIAEQFKDSLMSNADRFIIRNKDQIILCAKMSEIICVSEQV